MAFMLKLRWNIADGRTDAFRSNQAALCEVMHDDHPGVICYHVDYPEQNVSEWVEIYANDEAFRAHLANDAGKAPLAAVIAACGSIECRCFGDPDTDSREILKGFSATYPETAPNAFALNPRADRTSLV